MSTGGRRREGLNQQKNGGEEGSRPNARLKKKLLHLLFFYLLQFPRRAGHDVAVHGRIHRGLELVLVLCNEWSVAKGRKERGLSVDTSSASSCGLVF